MERKKIDDEQLEGVVGGTIMFSEDRSTCGYFRTDQYRVNNFDAAVDFIRKNRGKMSENSMLKKMVQAGYLSNL